MSFLYFLSYDIRHKNGDVMVVHVTSVRNLVWKCQKQKWERNMLVLWCLYLISFTVHGRLFRSTLYQIWWCADIWLCTHRLESAMRRKWREINDSRSWFAKFDWRCRSSFITHGRPALRSIRMSRLPGPGRGYNRLHVWARQSMRDNSTGQVSSTGQRWTYHVRLSFSCWRA